jgi:hypothetical protein
LPCSERPSSCVSGLRCSSSLMSPIRFACTARAENHREGRLSALRAHTKAPHKTDLLWETPRNAKAA